MSYFKWTKSTKYQDAECIMSNSITPQNLQRKFKAKATKGAFGNTLFNGESKSLHSNFAKIIRNMKRKARIREKAFSSSIGMVCLCPDCELKQRLIAQLT